jgi:translocation and assembly module TamB
VKFEGSITGPLANPRIAGQLEITRFEYNHRYFDRLTAHVDATQSGLDARAVTLARGNLQAQGDARLGLTGWKITDNSPLSISAAIRGATVQQLIAEAGIKARIDVNGSASVTIQVKGQFGSPEIAADIQASDVVAYGEQAGRVRVDATYKDGEIDVSRSDIAMGSAHVTATGSYRHVKDDWKTGEARFDVNGAGIMLTQLKAAQKLRQGVRGIVSVQARGAAKFEKGAASVEALDGDAQLRNLVVDGRPYGGLEATAKTSGGLLHIDASADLRGSKLQGQGAWRLSGGYGGQGRIEIPRLTVATLHDLAPGEHIRESLPFDGFLEGAVTIEGPLNKLDAMTARVTLTALQVSANPGAQPPAGAQTRDLVLRNSGPVVLEATTKSVAIVSAHFVAKDTTLDARGRLALDSKDPWNLDVDGNINLAILQIFNPDLLGSGASMLKAAIRGSLTDPQVDGRLELKDASLFLKDLPNGIDQANGVILFDRNRATVQSLTAMTGGGRVTFQTGSFVGFRGLALSYRLQATADNVRYRSPDGISVTVSAALTLFGTSDQSILSGTVTVMRAGFNPRTDVGGLLASTTRPEAITTTPNEYLRGIQFDVHILSAPTLEVQTSLTRNIQAEADLRLRGTPEKPVVLGNVTVTAGIIEFFGNKYSINRGSLNFYNPVKIEPIIDMDLETRERGITVDISFSGSLNKLNFSYRSDPPLETNQILALLAVGRAPTAANGLASSQTATNTSFMATGTNDLLSQAIAPQNGSLQRFFGVSHIKLDPQYTDLTSIPQARLTLEQQISKDITLTYITNLTRAAEQIVRVEWDLSRRWSVVALRDENGAFGIDFQYRKSFK